MWLGGHGGALDGGGGQDVGSDGGHLGPVHGDGDISHVDRGEKVVVLLLLVGGRDGPGQRGGDVQTRHVVLHPSLQAGVVGLDVCRAVTVISREVWLTLTLEAVHIVYTETAVETLGARGELTLVVSPLTDGAVVVGDTVTPVALVLHQAEGIVQTGAGLALGNLLLAVFPSPGERTDAVEISQEVEAVTLIEAGLGFTLVNIHLEPELSSPWSQIQITLIAMP